MIKLILTFYLITTMPNGIQIIPVELNKLLQRLHHIASTQMKMQSIIST